MTQGLNKVYLIGNLGQTPELKHTRSEQAVLSLRLATNERFKNRDGEWQDRTEWHTVVVWGRRAEGLAKIVHKGTQMCVEGRLQTRKWEDKQGNDRYTTEIVSKDIILLGGGKSGGGGGGAPPSGDGDYGGGGGGGGGEGDYSDDDIPF